MPFVRISGLRTNAAGVSASAERFGTPAGRRIKTIKTSKAARFSRGKFWHRLAVARGRAHCACPAAAHRAIEGFLAGERD